MIAIDASTKTIDEHFIDWEAHAFGYGYGTGEEHTLPALKSFFSAFGDADRPDSYEYAKLENALTPTVAWLLINILCRARIIEYGTSPRYGWLTRKGERLKEFVDQHTVEYLYDLCAGRDENYSVCYPDACNCGPDGYEKNRKCKNPFWAD